MSYLAYLRLLCWLHMARDERVTLIHVHTAFDIWADSQIGAA